MHFSVSLSLCVPLSVNAYLLFSPCVSLSNINVFFYSNISLYLFYIRINSSFLLFFYTVAIFYFNFCLSFFYLSLSVCLFPSVCMSVSLSVLLPSSVSFSLSFYVSLSVSLSLYQVLSICFYISEKTSESAHDFLHAVR